MIGMWVLGPSAACSGNGCRYRTNEYNVCTRAPRMPDRSRQRRYLCFGLFCKKCMQNFHVPSPSFQVYWQMCKRFIIRLAIPIYPVSFVTSYRCGICAPVRLWRAIQEYEMAIRTISDIYRIHRCKRSAGASGGMRSARRRESCVRQRISAARHGCAASDKTACTADRWARRWSWRRGTIPVLILTHSKSHIEYIEIWSVLITIRHVLHSPSLVRVTHFQHSALDLGECYGE